MEDRIIEKCPNCGAEDCYMITTHPDTLKKVVMCRYCGLIKEGEKQVKI